jgi:hypothetical protein
MKTWWVCDAKTFYPLQGQLHVGKEGYTAEVGLAQRVVLDLTRPFYNTNRNITCDNYFTSMELAKTQLLNGLTFVGTVRKNKRFLPSEALPSRQREIQSSIFFFQKNVTLVSYVPKKTKLLSCYLRCITTMT